ncbi:MAG: phage tail length tape measure family protein [Gammaproteobacteria bacterium]|nr:phage tail length tape measure family protein [Gammaproteobacteria bacterium]
MSGLGSMVVKLVLEARQFRTEFAQAATEAEAQVGRTKAATQAMTGAVQEAVSGQMTATSAATRAMSVLGPLGAAAAAVAITAAAAYNEAGKEAQGFERAIAMTGNAAGVTANSMADMARGIDVVVGTQAQAAQTLAQMAEGGRVAGANLQGFAQTAIQMERSLGQSIDKTVEKFNELGDAPVKASLKLNESLNYLTASTFEQIKAAEELGEKERAASIAQDAYATAMRERSADVEKHLGTLQRAWRGVRDFAKEAWDSMLNIGRADTTSQQLSRAAQSVETLESTLRSRQERGLASGDITPRLAAARELEQSLRDTFALEELNAAGKAAKVKLERDHVDFIAESDRYLTKQQQSERAVAAERARGQELVNAGLLTQQALEDRIAKVRERYTEKGRKGGTGGQSEAEKQLEREAAALAKHLGLTTDYLQQLQLLQAARDRGTLSEERYIEAVQHLISVQPMAKKLMDEQAKADTEAAKALEQHAKEREKFIVSLMVGVERIEAETQAQIEQNARLGLGAIAVAELDAAKLEMLATDRELSAIKVMDKQLDEQQYELLMAQARAYRELAQAKRDGAQRQTALDMEEASSKAAKRTQDTWERTAERIGDDLTDALTRGFESGKSIAENLRDTVVNMFKTMVLKPVISFALSPLSMALAGMFGMGGGAPQTVAGGGGGVMGMVQSASQLNTLWGMASQAMWGGSAGASMGSLMYANTVGALGGDSLGALISANGGWGGVPATGAAGAGGGAGGGMSAMGAGGIFAAIALAVANAFGVFREDKQVGGGLTGTLGGGDITNYALWRRSGTLFGGPDYSVMDPAKQIAASEARLEKMRAEGNGGSQSAMYLEIEIKNLKEQYAELIAGSKAQSDAIQNAYSQLRTNVGDMADVLGISSEAVRAFTTTLGSDLIHPDTGGVGLRFDGLNAEQINAKIQQALQTANNELAQQVIGTWERYTTTEINTVATNRGGEGENADWGYDEITTTTEGMRYVASEYARDGEKAIDTLTRLATSLSAVNASFDALGYTLIEASLAGGEAASKIVDAFGSLEQFLSATGRYMDLFYSPEEKTAAAQRQIDKELGKVGLTTPTSIEEYRKLVEAQDLNTEAGRRAYAVLVQLAPTFYEVANSAQELEDQARALKNAGLDAAYSALERAVAARRKAIGQERQFWQETADSLDGLVTMLRDHVRSLRGEVAATAAMQAQQGNAFINQALAAARSGGVLPDQNALDEAVVAARAGLDERNYATVEEWERDRLVLANKLEDLEGMGAEQLTTAERMLKAFDRELEILDEQLDTYKQLVDAAKGNVEATLTVAEAVRAIDAKLFPDTAESGGSGSGAPSGGGAVFGPGGSPTGGSPQQQKYKTPKATLSGGLVIYDYETDASRIAHLDKLSPTFHKYDGTGDLVGLAADIKANGGTAKDLAYLYGFSEKDVNKALDDHGIAHFDVGINRVPKDMDARIHKDELIVPADLNPFNPSASTPWGGASNSSRLESIMGGVLSAMNRCVAAATNSALSATAILDHLDDWSEVGLPHTRTVVTA